MVVAVVGVQSFGGHGGAPHCGGAVPVTPENTWDAGLDRHWAGPARRKALTYGPTQTVAMCVYRVTTETVPTDVLTLYDQS